jgi:DNA polymerase-3 subunit alpha
VRWAEGGEDDVSGGGAYTHMTLLAENTGMHNLFRLSSLAASRATTTSRDGPRAVEYPRPIIDHRVPVGEVPDRSRGRYASRQARRELRDSSAGELSAS